jgi:signal peptidase I
MIVRGDSMEPTYFLGDLLLIAAQPAYSVGDPVAYHVPAGEPGAGMLVVHRIAGLAPDGGFVMRGDNNPVDDPWRPDGKLIAGRVVLAVPKVGQLLGYVLQPVTAGALAAALMVMTILGRAGPSRPSQRSDSVWARLRRSRAPDPA